MLKNKIKRITIAVGAGLSFAFLSIPVKAASFTAELFGFPDSNPTGFFQYNMDFDGSDFEVIDTSIDVEFADGQTINFTDDDFQGNRSTRQYWFEYTPDPNNTFPNYILLLEYSNLQDAEAGDEIPATAEYRSRDANGVRITNEEVDGFLRISGDLPPVEPEPPIIPQPPTEPEPPIIPQPPVEPEPPVIPQPPVEPEPPVIPQPPVEPEPPIIPEDDPSEPIPEPTSILGSVILGLGYMWRKSKNKQ